jgi:excisionase family DNA binding protein/putative nucleotidyltransferase with HDIG domain
MRKRKALKVLLVEDGPAIGGVIKSELKKTRYSKDLIHTISGESDLEILQKEPFDLVLLDYPLAQKIILGMLKRVREMNLDIPVTMITGQKSAKVAMRAMERRTYEHSAKLGPLNTKQTAALLGVSVQTIKNYIYNGRLKTYKTPGGHHRIQREDIIKLGLLDEGTSWNELHPDCIIDILRALTDALDARNGIVSGHSSRVADFVTSLAEIMGISGEEQQNIKLAALLHDVGKVLISEQILSKPGKLTAQESYLIRQHPELGEKIVSGVEFFKEGKHLIRHHHERFDGKGYPDGLSGEEIPLGARMIFLAGAFDRITSDCIYQPKRDIGEAIEEIEKHAGTQFDPEIVRVFLENREKVLQR